MNSAVRNLKKERQLRQHSSNNLLKLNLLAHPYFTGVQVYLKPGGKMTFNKATVYGGGLIGGGWALNFVMHGVETTVYDLDNEKLEATRMRMLDSLQFLSSDDVAVLSKEEAEKCMMRIRFTYDVKDAVADALFIQENTPEKLEIKQSVIKEIEKYNSNAIIASSTSSLFITDIARNALYPERIVAGHPFNPVHIVPLVELVKGDKTSQETIDKAYAFYKEIGKEPVILNRENKGFIANSIQNAIYEQCHKLITDGICSVEDLDRAMVYGPGIRLGLLGPYMVLELAGGNGGIRSRMTKYGINPDIDLEAICTGTESELRNRDEHHGRTHEEMERFRDRGLVNTLKYHKKI